MLDNIDIRNTIEPVGTDFPAAKTESRTELGEAITSLWSAHGVAKTTARATKDELGIIRAQLGAHLHEMKQMLAKPGCDGQWSGFLREHRIPRATADRLVTRHYRSLNPDANRLTEAGGDPVEQEVLRLFTTLWPKLRRTLTSQKSLHCFIDLLTSHCPQGEPTDLEIPAPTTATKTFVPISPAEVVIDEYELLSTQPLD
jgi:hypothetical protein